MQFLVRVFGKAEPFRQLNNDSEAVANDHT